jgi:hypothetical protein
MAFSRFRFRLSTLLWIMFAAACWFGGMAADKKMGREEYEHRERELKGREATVQAKWDILSHFSKQGIPPTAPPGKKQHRITLSPGLPPRGEVIFESPELAK